jgi:phosphohistidine phosphatase
MEEASTLIVLVRHGEAEPSLMDDKSRSLTLRGRDQVSQAGKQISKFLPAFKGFAHALVSPYTRTQETFNILSVYFPVGDKHDCSVVTPISSVSDAQREVFKYVGRCESLLVVTHMPIVSFLTGELCNLDSPPLFMTSSFAVIKMDSLEGVGELKELVHQHD